MQLLCTGLLFCVLLTPCDAQCAVLVCGSADSSISPDGTMAAASTWHLTDPAAAADTAAADEQLTEKLLPLAVGLYRSEALVPTLQQYKSNAGEEVKEAVREVVQQVLPVLLSACGDSLPLQGGGARPGEVYAWEQLQVRDGSGLTGSRGARVCLVAMLGTPVQGVGLSTIL